MMYVKTLKRFHLLIKKHNTVKQHYAFLIANNYLLTYSEPFLDKSINFSIKSSIIFSVSSFTCISSSNSLIILNFCSYVYNIDLKNLKKVAMNNYTRLNLFELNRYIFRLNYQPYFQLLYLFEYFPLFRP